MAKNVIDFSKMKKVRLRFDRSYEVEMVNEILDRLKDCGFVEKADMLVYEPDDGIECVEAKIDADKHVCEFGVKAKLENRIYCGGKLHEKGESIECYVPISLQALARSRNSVEMCIKCILTKFRIKKKDIEAGCRV